MRLDDSTNSSLAMLNVLTPFLPSDIPPYASNICLEYWQNQFDNSIDVAMRYNGSYQPIFIEHYVESIVSLSSQFPSSSSRLSSTKTSARPSRFLSIWWMSCVTKTAFPKWKISSFACSRPRFVCLYLPNHQTFKIL